MKSESSVRVILIGIGNLGRRFAQIITDKHDGEGDRLLF